jgi:hypothetical protein
MATREELTAALDEAIALLRAQGRPVQASSLEHDREYIARGDYFGLASLRSTLSAMRDDSREEASPIAQALARAHRIVTDLEALGEQRWLATPSSQLPAPGEQQIPVVEMPPATLFAGFLIFIVLSAGAWLGHYPVGILVGLYYQTGPHLQAASDALTSGLVTLVVVYVLVFLAFLMGNKGNLGIPVGIIAGSVGCALVWLVRWP